MMAIKGLCSRLVKGYSYHVGVSLFMFIGLYAWLTFGRTDV
jgi:hypothetical protein